MNFSTWQKKKKKKYVIHGIVLSELLNLIEFQYLSAVNYEETSTQCESHSISAKLYHHK